jgi:predicted transcriptional regulator
VADTVSHRDQADDVPAIDPRVASVHELAEGLESTMPTMPKSAGRFYAAMFVYQDRAPFTAKMLCELLQVSTASASIALRALEGNGMIYRSRPAGSRSDLYDLVDELQYGQRYADRYQQPIASMRRTLASLEPGSKAWLRLSSAIDLFDYLSREVPKVFVRWQQENAAIYGR